MTTSTGQAVEPVTRGERWAGVAGALVGIVIVLICIDLATGGRLSARVTWGGPCECGDDKPE